MKLGYLVPQFPGQTHIFFWREVQELEKRGCEVVLFSTRKPPPGLISHAWSSDAMARTEYLGRIEPVQALLALPNVPLGELMRELMRDPSGEGRAFAKDALLSIPAARLLAASCKRQAITHVHVHSCGRAALIAALAQRMTGLRYSLTLHGPLADYGPGQRFKWRRAAFGTIITHKLLGEIRAELGADLPERLVIQPMGVDTDALKRDAPYAPPQPGETLKLFSCARLNIVKGHADLMQAVRLLLDRGVKVELDIAGEDDDGGNGYRKVLEARLAELKLAGHVRLLGAIDADDVKRRLIQSHVFVLASLHEPLGVALMEAMSCGVPTVGTAAGGVKELITDGKDGLLVPPQDPAALADALTSLASDPARCRALSEGGRARVVASFHSGLGAQTLLDEMKRSA